MKVRFVLFGKIVYPEQVATMKTDEDLVQIVDAALADATIRAGEHLACRPGCHQCCIGAFALNALDADRLRRGMEELASRDPDRALRLTQRVEISVSRTAAAFPGDVRSGLLDESAEGQARFEDFANDEMCPVLDPATGTCDLYAHRPMTCRVFGPPVRVAAAEPGSDQSAGLGVCELCFVNATQEEIAAAEMMVDADHLEDFLLETLAEKARVDGAVLGQTTVAYALSTRIG